MKKLLITLAGAFTISAAMPTFAGPDWQAIEHARKARHEAQAASPGEAHDAMAPTGAEPSKCPPEAPVPQLDHGPRAQTTPYVNRWRMDRYLAQLKACANVAK